MSSILDDHVKKKKIELFDAWRHLRKSYDDSGPWSQRLVRGEESAPEITVMSRRESIRTW